MFLNNISIVREGLEVVNKFFRIDKAVPPLGQKSLPACHLHDYGLHHLRKSPYHCSSRRSQGCRDDRHVLAASLATTLMGIFTNYPFALAPGMGLNAFLAFGVVLGMNIPWQTAMGVVFLEGLIILILVLTSSEKWSRIPYS